MKKTYRFKRSEQNSAAGKNNHGRQAEHKRKSMLRQGIQTLQGLTLERREVIFADFNRKGHDPSRIMKYWNRRIQTSIAGMKDSDGQSQNAMIF